MTSRRGGWSFINKSTSRIGFLFVRGRLATLALLGDGLECSFSFVFLFVVALCLVVALKPLAVGLAVATLLRVFVGLLALVAGIVRLLQVVKPGLERRQTLVLCLSSARRALSSGASSFDATPENATCLSSSFS